LPRQYKVTEFKEASVQTRQRFDLVEGLVTKRSCRNIVAVSK
jgi:hypothetical protein